MSAIVLYKSLYGSTKQYAEWIAEELSCEVKKVKEVSLDDLLKYDTIILGGGLYAETIAGVSLITRNFDKLSSKKLIVFTTGITPVDRRDYYDKLVLQKNFKDERMLLSVKVFNFMGKMVVSELSLPHRTALRGLKKLMAGKKNPTELEKMLIELCDVDGDFTDRSAISELVEYAKKQ